MAKKTKQSRVLFLGMVLGDGHLDKYGQLNIQHSEKQIDYLIWKHKLLRKHGISCTEIKPIISNGFLAYKFSTRVYDFAKMFRNVLYKPKKTLGILKQLNKLSALELAIWYMDDGSLTKLKNKDGYVRGCTLRLHTNVSKEENQVIIDFFKKKWNVSFTQNKKGNFYELVMHTKEARKFIQIVEPYVRRVPCMHYKIDNLKPLTLKSLTNGRAKWLEIGTTHTSDDIVKST